ncbi:hypothetical protein BDW60DRAFT_170838 [Aspergillus nidulans var. acristatus]
MSRSLSPPASEYLESIAKWFTTAEVKEVVVEDQNMSDSKMFKCVDMARFNILEPLLSELKLKSAGFTLWRVSGNITIEKKKGLDNLFFPLSIDENGIEVGGTKLMRHDFMRLTSDQPWSGDLDFLLVVIPEGKKIT